MPICFNLIVIFLELPRANLCSYGNYTSLYKILFKYMPPVPYDVLNSELISYKGYQPWLENLVNSSI